MRYLRTNTACRVTVGPFLDKTDAITPETALTVTNCHLTLMVDDGNVPTLILDAAATASGGSNDMVHVTNDDAGFYDLELAASNVNYLGRAMLAITDAANHCPVFHEFTILPAVVYDAMILGTDLFDVSVTQIAGSAVSTSTAQLGVNAVQIGATAQTGRDIGASVLLSPGTGTGQVDVTSGVVKANLVQILASAISGTAAQISAAFTKFFDKASPTGTINSIPDAVAGANGGLPTTNGTKLNQTTDVTAGQFVFKKNVARANFAFPMFDSTGALKTGLTVTTVIRKDAGSFTALAGSPTEIGTTGWYTVDFAQAETNADTIAFSATASGANPSCYTILTQA